MALMRLPRLELALFSLRPGHTYQASVCDPTTALLWMSEF
jgi:hypothetical protein